VIGKEKRTAKRIGLMSGKGVGKVAAPSLVTTNTGPVTSRGAVRDYAGAADDRV
jgi:hypothetical protein